MGSISIQHRHGQVHQCGQERRHRSLHQRCGVVRRREVLGDSPYFKEYLVWLFTLAMHWDIEIPALSLPSPAADASFQLLELLYSDQMETDGNTHHVCDNLPWEEQLEDLPKELLYLLQKASTGDRLDLSGALKEVSRWSGLPEL